MKDSIAEQLRDFFRMLEADTASPFRVPTVLLSRVCQSLELLGERQEFAELRAVYERARVGQEVDRKQALGVTLRALEARNAELPSEARAELVGWPRFR